MEEQIKRTARFTVYVYAVFLIIPSALGLCAEIGGWGVGFWAGDVRVTFWAETLTILSTAFCVPFALKVFAWVLAHRVDKISFPKALRLYARINTLRMLVLEVALLSGMLTYYVTLSSTGLLCAAIVVLASLFCLPGEQRLRKVLCFDKDMEQ